MPETVSTERLVVPEDDREPRRTCWRCERPQSVCYCASLCSLETRTRVVILQHPREEGMPIGTAHMASLCLPNSALHVGVQFDNDPRLVKELADIAGSAVLLYPGPGAQDLGAYRGKPLTLVVLDGTWWQAKKLLNQNPKLAALPRVAFTPERQSEYRIRREPQEDYVSTIEALHYALGSLEDEPARFDLLLRPFRVMIDTQLSYQGSSPRRGRAPRTVPRVPRFMRELSEARSELVVLAVEADALAYNAERRPSDRPIQFVLLRVSDGATLELFIDAGRPLAAHTLKHAELSASELSPLLSVDQALARLTEFCAGAPLCVFGNYAGRLLGDALPPLWDLRPSLRQLVGGGGLEEMHAIRCNRSLVTRGSGRAGRRAVCLQQLIDALADEAIEQLGTPPGNEAQQALTQR